MLLTVTVTRLSLSHARRSSISVSWGLGGYPQPCDSDLCPAAGGRKRELRDVMVFRGLPERRETTVVKLCSPNMLGVDSCVFLIFTTRVDQTNRSTLKLILFEKSLWNGIRFFFTTRVRKHLGNSARFSEPLASPGEGRNDR